MEKINKLFEAEVIQITESYPSIYSKGDVVSLLVTLRHRALLVINEELNGLVDVALAERGLGFITIDHMEEFMSSVSESLEKSISHGEIELVDNNNIELSMSYDNHVTVECVEIDTDTLCRELEDIMRNEYGELLNSLKIKEDE
jgi:hypothetical protein